MRALGKIFSWLFLIAGIVLSGTAITGLVWHGDQKIIAIAGGVGVLSLLLAFLIRRLFVPRNLIVGGGDHPEFKDIWEQRFFFIEKAGGPTLPKFKELSFAERRVVTFNVGALFFGPFYYAYKGLWKRALTYSGLMIGFTIIFLTVLEQYFGVPNFRMPAVGFAAVWCVMANRDYYRLKRLNNDEWI